MAAVNANDVDVTQMVFVREIVSMPMSPQDYDPKFALPSQKELWGILLCILAGALLGVGGALALGHRHWIILSAAGGAWSGLLAGSNPILPMTTFRLIMIIAAITLGCIGFRSMDNPVYSAIFLVLAGTYARYGSLKNTGGGAGGGNPF